MAAAPVQDARAETATAVPDATPETHEEKLLGRCDKDRDGVITREGHSLARRKAYAELDRDGVGRLGFDEWAVTTADKFAAADLDKSGAMNAAEFTVTAVKGRLARGVPCQPVRLDEG